MPGYNYNSNWTALWRRKRWFGIAYKVGIRIFEYNPESQDRTVAEVGGTFSRASTGTYYAGGQGANVERVIKVAPIDEIRDEHWVQWRDLSTENPLRKGALIERAAENIATFSEDFTNAVWSTTGVNVVADQAAIPIEPVEPDVGDLVEDTGFNGRHEITRVFNAPNGIFSFSVFVKRFGVGAKIRIRLSADGNDANSVELTFDETDLRPAATESGTSVLTGAAVDRNIQQWSRLMVGVETPGATSYTVKIMLLAPDGSESYQGVAGRGFYVWGAHAETEKYVTSYIRATGATSETRAADLLAFQWPLTTLAVPMNVLNRFQDLGTHIEPDDVYDHLGGNTPGGTPTLERIVSADSKVEAIHANSQGFNSAEGPQEMGLQFMVDSMTRLFGDGTIELVQAVEGQGLITVAGDANLISLEDWAGSPNSQLWIGGVNGQNMGAMVLFQLRMVDNPDATFIQAQKPSLLAKGLKVNPTPGFQDYAFVEDQAQDVFFSEVDPDAQSGYAVMVDDDTNALLIEEELGFWFIDDGI